MGTIFVLWIVRKELSFEINIDLCVNAGHESKSLQRTSKFFKSHTFQNLSATNLASADRCREGESDREWQDSEGQS